MKVLLINGSPRENGCTYTALTEVAGALNAGGIETELLHIGGRVQRGCAACGGCSATGRCVLDDAVNEALDLMEGCDALVLGSPVHYASASGDITGFGDRFFYAGGGGLAHKPGAAVVSARRAGTTAALDQLNKYFTISRMPIVSSQYWNMVHGNLPEQVRQDTEGLQIMRTLGRNMAWLLHCIEAGRKAGLTPPEPEEQRHVTNFIR